MSETNHKCAPEGTGIPIVEDDAVLVPTSSLQQQHDSKKTEVEEAEHDDTGTSSNRWRVGRTRICDTSGYRGTIMYVGPVASSSSSSSLQQNNKTKEKKKMYAGIWWDDDTRGKHNGTIIDPCTNQLIQYFKVPAASTSNGISNTCASFVPIHKVQYGISLTKDVILSKYVPLHSMECIAPNTILPNCTVQCAPRGSKHSNTSRSRISSSIAMRDNTIRNQPDSAETTLPSTSVGTTPTTPTIRYKPIQFIGEYNIRKYQQVQEDSTTNNNNHNKNNSVLHTISLRSYQLSSIDVTDLLQWTTTTTNESGNEEKDDTHQKQQQQQQYVTHSIYEIDLAGNLFCHDWQSVHDIVLHVFPNLIKLSFASNHIYDWTSPSIISSSCCCTGSTSLYGTNQYPNHSLRHLNLNTTKIQHLSTIYQIGKAFPNIQELIIANNRYCHETTITTGSATVTTTTTTTSDDESSSCIIPTVSTTTAATTNNTLNHINIGGVLQLATELAKVFPHLQLLDCSNCSLNFWSVSSFSDIDSINNNKDINDRQYSDSDTMALNKEENNDVHDEYYNTKIDNDDSYCISDDYHNLFVLLWSKLPKLQNISLDDNPSITQFIYPYSNNWNDTETTTGEQDNNDENVPRIFFPSLQQLQFVNTGVMDWMDIVPVWDEHVPTLQNVRFKYCPLIYGMSISNVRYQLIGHCPLITMINSTTITDQERREVAKQVIGGLSLNDPRIGTNTDQLHDNTERHRKYDYWVSNYPEIASSIRDHSNRDGSPTSIIGTTGQKSSYYTTSFAIVNMTFRSMASSSCTQEPFLRRLPTQMTIQKVKALCARQFGTDIDHQLLYFRQTTTDDSIPQLLDCNDHTLHYYGVPDGAEILMHEIDDHSRPAVDGAGVDIRDTTDDRQQRNRRELDERVDRLEQEMNDFQLRQKRITKK